MKTIINQLISLAIALIISLGALFIFYNAKDKGPDTIHSPKKEVEGEHAVSKSDEPEKSVAISDNLKLTDSLDEYKSITPKASKPAHLKQSHIKKDVTTELKEPVISKDDKKNSAMEEIENLRKELARQSVADSIRNKSFMDTLRTLKEDKDTDSAPAQITKAAVPSKKMVVDTKNEKKTTQDFDLQREGKLILNISKNPPKKGIPIRLLPDEESAIIVTSTNNKLPFKGRTKETERISSGQEGYWYRVKDGWIFGYYFSEKK